jgi:hypothetical protein
MTAENDLIRKMRYAEETKKIWWSKSERVLVGGLFEPGRATFAVLTHTVWIWRKEMRWKQNCQCLP